MSIEAIKTTLSSIAPIKSVIPEIKTDAATAAAPESFGTMLKDAMKEVNAVQQEADQKIEGLLLGKPGVSTHDAMIALEKADVAFQLMNQVRNRIIRAYEEVMRTQV